MSARNTQEQRLALYTNHENHNAQRHRQTDRRTERRKDYGNSQSYFAAERRAKNQSIGLFDDANGPWSFSSTQHI